MRVLWYSNETPDLKGQGGQRRQYFQIRALVSAGHHVTVASLAGPQDDRSARELAAVRRIQAGGRHPWRRQRAARSLAALLREPGWDRVVVAHLDSWKTLEACGASIAAPMLLEIHNVLSAWYARIGRDDLAAHWRAVETRAAHSADAVSVCSNREARSLGLVARAAPLVLPHGIDPHEWSFDPDPRDQPVVKLFGNWDWDPNRRGLNWFLEEVWPSLRASRFACEIAGSGIDAAQRGVLGVTTVGRVDSVPHFLSDAWAVAVPVRIGVGAPVKFPEACASGVPMLATQDAADVATIRGGLVSDDPALWLDQLRALENDPDEIRRDALARRAGALSDLSWDRVSAPLLEWVEGPNPRVSGDRAPRTGRRPGRG